MNIVCASCQESPQNGLKGCQSDCIECALHKRGRNPDTLRKPRKHLEEAFDRTWYGRTPIVTTEDKLRTRCAWLAFLYEAGWTEKEFEAASIPMQGRVFKIYKAEGER